MKNKYDPCEYCSGIVRETTRDESLWHKGKLTVIQDVPVGVCQKCGERYYKGAVLEALELLAKNRRQIRKIISVPVASFPA